MNKKFLALILCLMMVAMTGCGQASDETVEQEVEATVLSWQDQYDLGMKYLSEGNYEEAIIAFTAAIELEPKKADAYLGLSDVYLAMEDYELALVTLDKAYELEESNDVIERYQLIGAYEMELLCQAGDIDALALYLESEFYQKAFGSLDVTDAPIIIETDGMDFGIYPVENLALGSVMYYYGSIENGMRTGEALWVANANGNSYCASGTWENDKPNGAMEEEVQYGTQSNGRHLNRGTVVDGLWDGQLQMFISPDGTVMEFMGTLKMGIWDIIEEETGNANDFAVAYEYVDGVRNENSIYVVQDTAELYGILGFDNTAV